MSYKWNHAEIKKYSQAFANRVSEEFFKTNEIISGSEIINLTEIKQLNLFVLKELFVKWHLEVTKLKSPYFNYDEASVKLALVDFMNILSMHISVNKENFYNILNVATYQTLLLFTDPKLYFTEEMRNLPDFKLTQDWLNSNAKFFKDYNWVLKELLNKLNGASFVYANEAIVYINDFFEDLKVEDHTSQVLIIAKIAGLDERKDAKTVSNASFFDSIEDYGNVSSSVADEVIISKHEILNEPKADIKPEVIQVKEESVIFDVQSSKSKMNDSKVTLHESMQLGNANSSLSDFHQKRKIDTIKGNISLNQKFLFINNLFGSDADIFDNAVKELESCNSFSEAKEQMLKKYLPRYKWDLNSPEAEEFFDLLKRRFN